MNINLITKSAVLLAALGLGVAATLLGESPQSPLPVPELPATPQEGDVGLLSAQRFELDRAYSHGWRRERPSVRSGWLLVLSVKPDLVRRLETHEPVLYVGSQTAERINVGFESGHVVAVVPGDFQLEDAPIFFGSPALPEEVDAARIEMELRAAMGAGKRAMSAGQVAAVLGDPLHLGDQDELRMMAIDLIQEFSPQERGLIESSLVPRLR